MVQNFRSIPLFVFLCCFKLSLFVPLDDTYTVGTAEDIMLEIKPNCLTGILLSSSSSSAKGDFITLEMVRGNVSNTYSNN